MRGSTLSCFEIIASIRINKIRVNQELFWKWICKCDGIIFKLLGEIVNVHSSFLFKAWIIISCEWYSSIFACNSYIILMSLPYLWVTSTKTPEPHMDPKLSTWNFENTLVFFVQPRPQENGLWNYYLILSYRVESPLENIATYIRIVCSFVRN